MGRMAPNWENYNLKGDEAEVRGNSSTQIV